MFAAEVLAEFCASLRWPELPSQARERAKELVLDFLGVAARGSGEESSRAVAAFVREAQPAGGAMVIGARLRSSAAWAALANGTAGHAIELDDVTTESSLHPGVAVVPAALAMAEERGRSGQRFLEAVIAGYEVTMRVGNALNPASAYRRGFHPTGVAGVFGAAMAAGLLLDLEPKALVRALGIAGTLAAGSLEYLADGSYTKRLNAGWAAHGGVVAAGLAGAGFTGPASVLEGRLGVLHAYTDAPAPERLLADLGKPLQITRVSIKPYACCRYNHGLIDCVLALRREHRIDPEDVERIRLGVLSGGALLVAEPIEQKRAPTNVVDAQFSAPFAAALALVRGATGFADYTSANVADPLIRHLMSRTECYRDPALDASYPARWPAAAEITLRDGRVVSTRIEFATGEPENPVPRAGLIDKFTSLAANLLPDEKARALAGRILRIDEENDVRFALEKLAG
jgi:2-methylcitrate dehydratase PrpD